MAERISWTRWRDRGGFFYLPNRLCGEAASSIVVNESIFLRGESWHQFFRGGIKQGQTPWRSMAAVDDR